MYTDASDGLLITATVPAADRFGWTTFAVKVGKIISNVVNTTTGAVTTVITAKMSL